MNWHDWSYLRSGSPEQQKVFQVLTESSVMDILKGYDPVLCGTYPIGINIPGSDLDIICECKSLPRFEAHIERYFSRHEEYRSHRKKVRNTETVIARFKFKGYKFEVFGQQTPTKMQYAYRHMIIEHGLLKKHGDHFRQKVMALKEKGLSTEEAFADILNIKGDPYEGLLDYE